MKHRLQHIVPLLLFSLTHAGCGVTARQQHQPQLYYAAPSELSGTPRQMKTAGFWIMQHPTPNKLLMDEAQIAEFNRHIREDLKLTKDILNLPEDISGPQLVEEWRAKLAELQTEGLYRADGRKADEAFFNKIKDEITETAVTLKITPRFGFIVRYSDQRIFPTSEPLYAKAGDIDFDELQNSTLDVGTPVAVLSASQNDEWYYVQSALSDGWVKKDQVVICDVEQIRFFYDEKYFVVVTRAKADIFTDMALTQQHDYARMGTRLVRHEVYDNGVVSVWLPQRNETDGKMMFVTGYMRVTDVHEGYLPYTAGHVITQAFELLNEPYGWGGMYGEQDCSAFLDEVFATVGIVLPRNSSAQRKSGKILAQFGAESTTGEKIGALRNAPGGTTLLGMKGHIMLSLGMLNGHPYTIHAVWAYRESSGVKEDRVRVINRVAVSDLYLGQGSQKGSLLDRLTEIVEVGL